MTQAFPVDQVMDIEVEDKDVINHKIEVEDKFEVKDKFEVEDKQTSIRSGTDTSTSSVLRLAATSRFRLQAN